MSGLRGQLHAWAADYNPFGVATITNTNDAEITNTNPYTFANGFADRTTGWIHYAARYYDPTTATWTQQDPVDAPLDPNNANRYSYAGNDPINNTDPTGLQISLMEACIINGVGGGIAGAVAGAIVVGTGTVGVGIGPGMGTGFVAGFIGGCVGGMAMQLLTGWADRD